MKILIFTDMHGDRRAVDVARAIAEKDDIDMIAYLGDFSERISDVKQNIEDAEYMIGRLGDVAEVKALFGNCDTPELRDFLEEQGVSLHNKALLNENTAIVGWGGSHPTPFHTPSEFSEAEIEEALRELMDDVAKKGAEKMVLLTHEPPARTEADKLPGGHVGSEALRSIVEEYQPNLHVCGHIHERKSRDKVKGTDVINVGPAFNGHFLSVDTDKDIRTEEINI